MDNWRLTLPNVDGFVKFIKVPGVVKDAPWKELF
jgi:hypothetical protein